MTSIVASSSWLLEFQGQLPAVAKRARQLLLRCTSFVAFRSCWPDYVSLDEYTAHEHFSSAAHSLAILRVQSSYVSFFSLYTHH
jgi:hypothetical protein